MTLAQQAGLRDGITFPWHGANGHVGLLSLITSTPRTRAQWLSAVPFLSWLSMHIFEAVVRVCLVGESSHDALSLRELWPQCLALLGFFLAFTGLSLAMLKKQEA